MNLLSVGVYLILRERTEMIFTNETSATCIFNIAAQWPPEATDAKTAQRHTDTMRFPFMSIIG